MRVYIAGPYTKGDVVVNVRNAILLGAEKVAAAGHHPYVPHLSHFWHLIAPHEYDFWLREDMEWLRCCDALIRLPGESSGADGEVLAADEDGIPVYYSVAEFLSKNHTRPIK